MELITEIIKSVGLFIVFPLALFSFLHLRKKSKADLEMAASRNKTLELEVEKERLMLERMSLENKMLDARIGELEK